jgi:hypothetical protein
MLDVATRYVLVSECAGREEAVLKAWHVWSSGKWHLRRDEWVLVLTSIAIYRYFSIDAFLIDAQNTDS